MNEWEVTKEELYAEARTCQVYRNGRDCGDSADQLDHAIFSGKQKSKRLKKATRDWLNSRFNAQRACRECNVDQRWADTREAKEHHIARELERDYHGFLRWYWDAPEGISRKAGGAWRETKEIVARYM